MLAVKPSIFGSRILVLISVLSLVLVIIVLSVVAGWFWGVPSRVKDQEKVICQGSPLPTLSHYFQEVERLESLIENQQLMIDHLMAEKSESYMAPKVRDQHPQDQDTTSDHEDICSLPAVPGPCTTANPEMALSSTIKNLQAVHIRWLPWKHEQLSYGYGL